MTLILFSLNSFNPSSIESFVFIFNPFLMGILLFIKVLLPFIPTCAGLLAVIRIGFQSGWKYNSLASCKNHNKNRKLMFFVNDESNYFIIWYDEPEFFLSCERGRELARCRAVDIKFFNCLTYEYKYNIDNGISKLSYNKVIHCQPKTSMTFYFNKICL